MKNENLKKLLSFDSLDAAEKITGESYKENEDVGFLGMALMMENNKKKNELLDSMGDTKSSNTVSSYLTIAESAGFEIVLVEPFTSDKGVNENLYILWNNELGILLSFDSHTWEDDGSWAKSGKEVPPPNVNGGKFYYNIKLKPIDERDHGCTSSGSYSKEHSGVWVGNHDCREALKFNINYLKENGEFLREWVERPFLWLLNYSDTKGDYDYEKLNEERISKLPKHVIDAISPNS